MALPVNVGDLVVVDYGAGARSRTGQPRLILSIRPALGSGSPPSRWEVEYLYPKEQIKGYMSVYETTGGNWYPVLTLYNPEEEIKEQKEE